MFESASQKHNCAIPLFLKTADPWYPMRSDLARNKKRNKNTRQVY